MVESGQSPSLLWRILFSRTWRQLFLDGRGTPVKSVINALPLLLLQFPLFGPGIRWTSQRRDWIPASDRSSIFLPPKRRAVSRWVASRKTLLRTNGSHDRCTIDFVRSILRPFAYRRLGGQATEATSFYRKQSFVEASRGMKVGRPTTT